MLSVPVYCNILWSDSQAAQNCPTGDIKLAFCSECGLISNVAFDPTRLGYDQDYENSLHYSPRFQNYAQSLASELVERHKLVNKNIIEIGCGKGDFLISLCELGNNRGVGFDPSYVPRPEHEQYADRVRFVQDFYSEHYQDYQAELICCRHTLEHFPNPATLLKPLRQAIANSLSTAIFFEVPNALYTFRHLAIWDIIYEHCCYFTPTSLAQAFVNCGFQVDYIKETFDGQFLCLESKPVDRAIANQKKPKVEAFQDIAAFRTKFDDLIDTWTHKLAQIAQTGQKAVVWGAGSKGVTFLNLLKSQAVIQYVVDLNPRKHGMYIAGTGQQIVPPEFLRHYQPDLIIVMNPIYEAEIRQITEDLDLAPEFIHCVPTH